MFPVFFQSISYPFLSIPTNTTLLLALVPSHAGLPALWVSLLKSGLYQWCCCQSAILPCHSFTHKLLMPCATYRLSSHSSGWLLRDFIIFPHTVWPTLSPTTSKCQFYSWQLGLFIAFQICSGLPICLWTWCFHFLELSHQILLHILQTLHVHCQTQQPVSYFCLLNKTLNSLLARTVV